MTDRTRAVVFSVIGGCIAGGFPALLHWLFTPFWPACVAVLIFTAIGLLLTFMLLSSYLSWDNDRTKMVLRGILCIIAGGSVIAVLMFGMWQRSSLASLLFGAAWAVLVSIAAQVYVSADHAWKKEHNPDYVCPSCDHPLRYKGQGYAGYSDSARSGNVMRTSHYESVYKCPKCGYTK